MRYGKLAHDLQMVARRKMICGMHVHVDIPEGVSRVDLMVRMLPFVPLLPRPLDLLARSGTRIAPG